MIRTRLFCIVACGALLVSPASALAQAAPEAPKGKAPPAQKKAAPAPPPAVPAIGGVQPSLLGQFGEWAAYTASPASGKVCFALARPTSSQINPPGRSRDPAYMFIASRPADKPPVKNEVSVMVGFPMKEKSTVAVEIGTTKFSMYTNKDGAWIDKFEDERRMIEAMRKGSELVIKASSAKGAQSTDRFSLSGFTQALDRVAQECP